MQKKYLEAGVIVKPHGVKGELVLEPWADSPEFLCGVPRLFWNEGEADAGLISARVHKNRLLIALKGINSPEEAEKLRGRILYLCRDDVKLPDGTFFLEDLVGLDAIDKNTGKRYGSLKEVISGVANDVYVIADEAGKEYYFPAVKSMLGEIDIENGFIELIPIPGIFDEEGVMA